MGRRAYYIEVYTGNLEPGKGTAYRRFDADRHVVHSTGTLTLYRRRFGDEEIIAQFARGAFASWYVDEGKS